MTFGPTINPTVRHLRPREALSPLHCKKCIFVKQLQLWLSKFRPGSYDFTMLSTQNDPNLLKIFAII